MDKSVFCTCIRGIKHVVLSRDKIFAPAAKAEGRIANRDRELSREHERSTDRANHDLCSGARAYGPGYIIVAITMARNAILTLSGALSHNVS